MLEMMKTGIQNSLSDGGVGVLCSKTAVTGAYFNVRINAKDIKDRKFATTILEKAEEVYQKTIVLENEMMKIIDENI
jgi:glutamate formiminotransferase/formiminotetrahydrofolate cyclodeaminase